MSWKYLLYKLKKNFLTNTQRKINNFFVKKIVYSWSCPCIDHHFYSWKEYDMSDLPSSISLGVGSSASLDPLNETKVLSTKLEPAVLAQFAQVEQSDLLQLGDKRQQGIKSGLIKAKHWSSADTSRSLKQRIEDDSFLISAAGLDRYRVLLTHEEMKRYFDAYVLEESKGGSYSPFKRGTVANLPSTKPTQPSTVIYTGGDASMVTQSIDPQALAQKAGFDLAQQYGDLFRTGVVVSVYHMRWDDLQPLLEKKKIAHQLFQCLSNVKEHRTNFAAQDRDTFVKRFGHLQHVVELRNTFEQFRSEESRQRWKLYDEAMLLIGDLLVLRIEWGGSEQCPIYNAFEKSYIGYRRGNFDWFIRDVKTGAQVWIPDLSIYQLGLFGFLQDADSPYRFDIANYCATFKV